jgi:peptide/nickel transport system substrate-binding protein
MKRSHLHGSFSGPILIAVLAILLPLCVGPAYSASEPGTVIIVLNGEPHSLDPSVTTMSNVIHVLRENIVETLTEVNPTDGSVIPRLALSWKRVDPNTWQFSLRKGVKFHDGEDFNARAVILNIKRLYSDKVPTMSSLAALVKMEGTALDSHTLEVKTDKAQPILPTVLAFLAIFSPNTPTDKATRQPIGTGPYKFVKWDAGTQIVSERFDGYWGKQPQVKRAVYVWRGESSVRAAMVEIGEADIAVEIAKQDARRPDMDYTYVSSETGGLYLTAEVPPLSDRRVRLALNYAVDRDAIRGSILSKDVIPAAQLVGPSVLGFNPDLKPWPYDPKKARQLLDEARKDGVPVDREILLAGRTGFYSGNGELMEALITMYRAVGLNNVKLKMMETGVHKPYDKKPFPEGPYMLEALHGNEMGDAAYTVFGRYHCEGDKSHTCDRTLDELIEKAQVATGEGRRTLWRAAFKRIHEDVVSNVFLFHMVGFTRVGKRINYKPSIAISNGLELAQITFRQ